MKKVLLLVVCLISTNCWAEKQETQIGRYQIVANNGLVVDRVVYAPGWVKIDTVSGKSWVLSEGKWMEINTEIMKK